MSKKSSVFLNEHIGPVRSLTGLKALVGWIPFPLSAKRITPFPGIIGQRINLTGSVPLNGVASGVPTTGTGILVSSDTLSAGQYMFEFNLPKRAGLGDDYDLRIIDRQGNTVISLNVMPGASDPTSAIDRMNLPIAEGQHVELIRKATSGITIQCFLTWTYLSAYKSNDPLSLAARGVQSTEPGSLGQTVGITPIQSAPIYGGATEGSGGGDSGGDGGPSE